MKVELYRTWKWSRNVSVEIEFGTDHFGRTTQEGQHKKTPSHLTSQFPYHLYVNKNLFEINTASA